MHQSSKEDRNINNFKLKDLYDYNNIDQMILAAEKPNYDILLQNLSIIKNYIELFFSHCDKFLKDFSVLGKQSFIELKGTTYIDDFVDSETTNNNFNELKKSLDSINTTIKKTLPADESVTGTDNYSQVMNNALNGVISYFRRAIVALKDVILDNLELTTAEKKKITDAFVEASITMPDSNAFLRSIIPSIKEYINKTDFKLSITKPSEMEDVKTSKAFNLEAYNNEYDREDNTGFQVEHYKYNEFLPEYGYLYSKPADGISIKKEVDVQEINGRMYHNNINTVV